MGQSILENQNVLVTGGTGFVGGHLVEELLKKNCNIVCLYQTQQPFSYFVLSGFDKKVSMVHTSIESYEDILHAITKFDINYIFHLAAQPLVDVAYYNPRKTLITNIAGTINILEAARSYPRVKGIVVASSDKAYGKTEKKFYLESDPLRGDHPYEVSKSATDLIAFSYFKTYGLPVVVSRFGNVYGEGDLNFSRILPGIMKSLINDSPLDIRSNGKFVRDYIYVKDVARGYLMLGEHSEECKGEAYNFGSEDTLSVLQVLKAVEKILNKKIRYNILDIAKNEIPYQALDFTKIKKKLGWQPETRMSDILPRIQKWYYRYYLHLLG